MKLLSANLKRYTGSMDKELYCDLVLEGGGVKGLGLVGALDVLEEKHYHFQRIGGTSAGAVVGALAAAGMSPKQLHQTMQTLDYKKFQDEGIIDRLGLPGKGLSLLFEQGVYEGNYLHTWLAEQLASLGVRTFSDLRITEPWGEQLPPEKRYKLVVVATDVTRGKLIRLPWDYAEYDLNPDTQLIADAVRASMSVPFFYEPVTLGQSKLIDGAMLSNFPIDLFDEITSWPTFGIKLSARLENTCNLQPSQNTIDFAKAVLTTMVNARDQVHLENPSVISRTIFIDTAEVQTLDFGVTLEQQALLYENGRRAAGKLLNGWDFNKWKATYLVNG